jgi:recombination protein RecA
MKEADRQRAIQLKLARQEIQHRAAISTGFAALDSALGGCGLPRGRIVELFGPPACGKTTLALQIAARVQRDSGTSAWIDAEHGFDPAYSASLGVANEDLPLVQPESAEQALEIARALAVSGAVDLIVIDSAAALVPRLELEAGLGESGPGLQSRVLASGLRALSGAVAKSGALLILLNQLRSRMGAADEEVETSAGGAALKLYSAVRIALNRGTGGRLRFRVVKNKASRAFSEGELEWNARSGFAETP